MKRIVQLVPAHHETDAIGQHIRTIHTYFQSIGWESYIMALHADPGLQAITLKAEYDRMRELEPAYWVYHYALPSTLTALFTTMQGKRILIYHNLTPPEYFLPWNPSLAFLTLTGRKELHYLKDHTDWAVADSLFNATELNQLGYEHVDVMPILIDWDNYPTPSPIAREQYFDPFYQYWLFVGRVVPNKRLEDLIRTFFWYRKFYNLATRLFIVGKLNNTPRYVYWLTELREALHLEPQDVSFLGPVPYEDLAALYAGADVLLTLSDHEGFCLPLLEAMHYDTPIVAYAAGAIPETLGPAGALVSTRDPIVLADFMDDFLRHRARSSAFERFRQNQLERFEPLSHLIQFKEKLETL